MKYSLVLISTGVLFAAAAQAQDQTTNFTTGDGTRVTLTSGQPAPDRSGPPPAFAQLDANRDGSISRDEAEAYTPLANDFDYLAHHADRISRAKYEHWVQTQGH